MDTPQQPKSIQGANSTPAATSAAKKRVRPGKDTGSSPQQQQKVSSTPRSPESPGKNGQPKAKRQRKAKEAFSPAQQPRARTSAGPKKPKKPKGEEAAGAGKADVQSNKQASHEATPPLPGASPFPQLLRRVKAQLSRMRQEQALLDVYAAEGWRGSKKEAVRPHSELARAAAQVKKCRASIRDCVRLCEESEGERPIPPELFNEDGELDEEFIFCCRCTETDAPEENDVVLCDGPCNRAYHFWCVRPLLQEADLNDDEGWLCPGCDAKADIVHELNDALGTDYEVELGWQDMLPEPSSQPGSENAGANGHHGPATLLGGDLPSEDESDFSFRESSSSSEAGKQHSSTLAGEHASVESSEHGPDEVHALAGSTSSGETQSMTDRHHAHLSSQDRSSRRSLEGRSPCLAKLAGDGSDEEDSDGAHGFSSSSGSGIDESASDASHRSDVEVMPRIRRRAARAGSSEAPRSQHTPTESHQTTPEEELEPIGPRQGRRRPVDYVQLAAAMFGGPDGEREGDEDQDYSPGKDRQRASLGSADADACEKGGPDS